MEIVLKNERKMGGSLHSLKLPLLENLTKLINTILIWFLVSMATTIIAIAADNGELTDFFYIEGARGSTKWIEDFDFLGHAMQYLISAVCIIVIFFIIFQKILTISYFCLREFWDNVHEVKQSHVGGSGKIPFGLQGYFEDAIGGKKSSGIDSVFHLIFIFIPDMYMLSEMGSIEKGNSRLTKEDTVFSWLIKTGPSTIFGLLLLYMGFNGSLMKCYAMVVEGLGVVGERVASANSKEFVTKLLNSGDEYRFSLDVEGTDGGYLRQDIANKIYTEILYNQDIIPEEQRSSDVKSSLGGNIETWVARNCTDAAMIKALEAKRGNGATLDPKYINKINFSIGIVPSASVPSNGSCITVPVSQFAADTQNRVIMIGFTAPANVGSYTTINRTNNSNSNSNSNGNGGKPNGTTK